MLLAEQVGIELETEDGFGSGLFSKITERHGSAGPEASEQPPPAASSEGNGSPYAIPAEPNDPAYELSALRAELELLRARNAQLEAEVTALPKKPAGAAARRSLLA